MLALLVVEDLVTNPGEKRKRANVARRRTTPGGRWRLLRLIGVLLAVVTVLISNVLNKAPLIERGDLGAFLSSGRAAAAGLDPYAASFPLGRGPNLNPPITVLAFQAVAGITPAIVGWAWWIASLGAIGLMLILFRRAFPRCTTVTHVAVLLGSAGLWAGLAEGQIYPMLGLVSAGAWLLLPRHRIAAGVLIGIAVAIKPNFAVWIVLLLLSGSWLPVLTASVITLLLSLLPLLFYGPAVYRSWLDVISVGSSGAAANASLLAFWSRFGVPQIGDVSILGLMLASAAWAWWRRPDAALVSNWALILALLVSPIAWVTYQVFLLPVFCSRCWTPAVWMAALLQLLPYWVLWLPSMQTGIGLVVVGTATSGVLFLLLGDLATGRAPAMSLPSRALP